MKLLCEVCREANRRIACTTGLYLHIFQRCTTIKKNLQLVNTQERHITSKTTDSIPHATNFFKTKSIDYYQ
jgi:hypothetical protein